MRRYPDPTTRKGSRTSRSVAWGSLLLIGLAVGLGGVAAGCGDERAAASDRGAADAQAAPRLATAEFDVEGMTCGGCALATEMAL